MSVASPDGPPTGRVDAVALADAFGATAKLLGRLLSERLDGEGASMPRLRLLAELAAHGPMRLTELAHRLGVSQGPTSALVDALIRDALVERTTDPDDRRATRLAVTDAGRERADTWSQNYRNAAADIFAALPDQDWPVLKNILDTLQRQPTRAPTR